MQKQRRAVVIARGFAPLACALLFANSAATATATADAAQLDLMGTWYVLVHYRDDATNNPEVDRWEDRIWLFGKKGSRLSWTEYPIVIFRNPEGRFERTLSGVEGRVLAAWEPNERQLAEIADGLEVNSRGSKTKTLRGSVSKGYESVGGLRTQSVSVIGYHETWSIEGLPERPIFTRDDLMGSGRTEMMEGRTQYSATEVLDGGRLIRGRFERDGTRHGVFRMMKSGDVAKAGKGKKKQDAGPRRPYPSVFASPKDKREIAELAARGDSLEGEELERLRARLRQSIGRSLREFGLEGPALALRTESLSEQIEVLLIEQAKSVDELDDMARQGQIQP